jgi:predicted GNAT family acetyltransferase
MPLRGTPAERQALFEQIVQACRMWGYIEDGRLLAMAGLNEVYKHLGQVAGVYTVPDRRRSGLSRAVMNALLADSAHLHSLKRLILFTGEHNQPAQHLYATLGFSTIGHFALLMCEPIAED